jgi:hypothetical protein
LEISPLLPKGHMGLLDELKKSLKVAGEQLTSSSKTSKGLRFTSKFHTQAKSWGLTQADAQDVYHHGEERKSGMMVRNYGGYEIGIYYFKDGRTGQVVISSIWKRGTR